MTVSNWKDATKHSDLAEAIAHAEGFGLPDAIPTKAHNPGDLVCSWLTGEKMGAECIHVFQDDATGWAALEHELQLISVGKSHVYVRGMTIREMAEHWTRTQQNEWAQNVASKLTSLGRTATVDTLLKEVL
jgi:hypothetical protein